MTFAANLSAAVARAWVRVRQPFVYLDLSTERRQMFARHTDPGA